MLIPNLSRLETKSFETLLKHGLNICRAMQSNSLHLHHQTHRSCGFTTSGRSLLLWQHNSWNWIICSIRVHNTVFR